MPEGTPIPLGPLVSLAPGKPLLKAGGTPLHGGSRMLDSRPSAAGPQR